jgi:hypothetical protein
MKSIATSWFGLLLTIQWQYRATCIVMTTLLVFYLTLIGLWLSPHVFDIKRLEHVSRDMSLGRQAVAVGILSVIASKVPAIASDLAIRRCLSNSFAHPWVCWLIQFSWLGQTVAALHDTLASWLGIPYAVQALYNNWNDCQIRCQHILTLVFFLMISVLHILIPSVIAVHAVNAMVQSDVSVIKMPGNLAHIAPSAEAQNEISLAVTPIPLLWDQRDSRVGLPMGHNGMYVCIEGQATILPRLTDSQILLVGCCSANWKVP